MAKKENNFDLDRIKQIRDGKNKAKKENDFVFESEFDLDKIKQSAELEIKPKIEFNELGIEYAKDVIIKGTYYNVEIPKEKAMSSNTTLRALNMIYNGVEHQFFAESESFRYQLEVIRYKKKLSIDNIDGLKLRIWVNEQYINTPKFKGKAKVYNLKALN